MFTCTLNLILHLNRNRKQSLQPRDSHTVLYIIMWHFHSCLLVSITQLGYDFGAISRFPVFLVFVLRLNVKLPSSHLTRRRRHPSLILWDEFPKCQNIFKSTFHLMRLYHKRKRVFQPSKQLWQRFLDPAYNRDEAQMLKLILIP